MLGKITCRRIPEIQKMTTMMMKEKDKYPVISAFLLVATMTRWLDKFLHNCRLSTRVGMRKELSLVTFSEQMTIPSLVLFVVVGGFETRGRCLSNNAFLL